MPSGFEAYNESGTIQVSSSFPGVSLYSKGTMTLSTVEIHANNFKIGYLELPFNDALIAIRCDQKPITTRRVYSSGTNFRYELKATSDTDVVVDYFVFAPSNRQSPSPTNVGLQVFSESGELMFDAGRFPMIVKGAYTVSPATNGPVSTDDIGYGINQTVSVATPSGRLYAAIQSSFSNATAQIPLDLLAPGFPPTPGYVYTETRIDWSGVLFSGASIEMGYFTSEQLGSWGPPPPIMGSYTSYGKSDFIIVDVTDA